MKLLNQEFTLSGKATLDVDRIPTTVRISRSNGSTVSVSISGPEKYMNEVSATQSGDTVIVRGPERYVGGIVMSGNSVSVTSISGGSISISGGRVIVNGKDITSQAVDSSSDDEPLVFEISLPDDSNLVLGQVGDFTCEPNIDEARFALSGQSDVNLGNVVTVKGFASGQSNIEIENMSGDRLRLRTSGQSGISVNGLNSCEVEFTMSGQGNAEFEGSFLSVEVETSGQTSVRTNGAVNGDYIANANGLSRITHRGGVQGQVRDSSSGMSKVSIR